MWACAQVNQSGVSRISCGRARRWAGVPWIMKAGKALNERKVEIRVQYKPPAAGIHDQLDDMRNELVVRCPAPLIRLCWQSWCKFNACATTMVCSWPSMSRNGSGCAAFSQGYAEQKGTG